MTTLAKPVVRNRIPKGDVGRFHHAREFAPRPVKATVCRVGLRIGEEPKPFAIRWVVPQRQRILDLEAIDVETIVPEAVDIGTRAGPEFKYLARSSKKKPLTASMRMKRGTR